MLVTQSNSNNNTNLT